MMTTTNTIAYQVFEHGCSGFYGVRKLVNDVEVTRTITGLTKAAAERVAKAAAR